MTTTDAPLAALDGGGDTDADEQARAGWRNRRVGFDLVEPDQLLAHPDNWRLHSTEQKEVMEGALSELGWLDAVKVNINTSHVFNGHMRVDLALKEQERTGSCPVPVEYYDLTIEEEHKALVYFDSIGAMAGTDKDKLAGLMGEIKASDSRLSKLMDDLKAKSGLLKRQEQLLERDDDGEGPANGAAGRTRTRTQPGDIIQMGPHRLACGSAADYGLLERLMDGQKAALVLTDPPYGVQNAQGAKDERNGRHVYQSGVTIEGDTLAGVLTAVKEGLTNALAVTEPGASWYVFGPAMAEPMMAFATILSALDVWRHTLVWVKSSLVFGRADYHYQHETIFYGWTPGGAHHKVEDRTMSSVWAIDYEQRNDKDTPIHKPLALSVRAIRNSSHSNAVVLDPFAGSGGTLLACEREYRRAYLIEIDPATCDGIVARWERASGNAALWPSRPDTLAQSEEDLDNAEED